MGSLNCSQADRHASQADRHPNRQTPKQTDRQTAQQADRWEIGSVGKKQANHGNRRALPDGFEFEKNFDQDWARQWVQAYWVPLCSSAGFVYLLLIYLGRGWMAS